MRTTHFVQILSSLAARVVLLAVVGAVLRHSPASANERHALVVDVGDFQHLAPLEHATQDVEGMSAALLRGGLQLQTVTPANSQELVNGVTKWVNDTKKKPSLALLYYRGHLLLGADNCPRLAVATTKPAQVANDGTSLLSLLELLSKCDSAVVLLDVDCGDIPESDLQQVVKATLAKLDSKAAVGIVIGCSRTSASKNDQPGRSAITSVWSQRLRGDIEQSRSGALTWQDLVTSSQRELSSGRATLVIDRLPALSQSGVLASVKPRKLDELLSDLGDRIASELHRHGVEGTAIPDFQVQAAEGVKSVGQDFGPLLRYCGQKLRSEIAARANFRYRLLSEDWLRSRLQDLELGPQTIQGPAMMTLGESLRKEVGNKPVAVVLCELKQTAGHSVEISCSPWNPQSGATFTTASGSALLNPSEWAMIGRSAVNELGMTEFRNAAPKVSLSKETPTKNNDTLKTDRTRATTQKANKKPYPLLDYGNVDDQAQIRSEIASLEEKARRSHPMKDKFFPFRVSLKRNGSVLPESWSDDDRQLTVKVNKGDRYTVWVENQSTQPVFMRLLVDGLNTLPDHPLLTTEGHFEVVGKDLAKTTSPAQYANLTNAKAWFCEPGKYEVRGFFTAIDDQNSGPERDAQRAAFVVTDASDSEAWRKGYLKDVGIVTAAFYKPTDRPDRPMSLAAQPRLGTKLGEIGQEKVEVYQGQQVPGELLAVVHLRYGDFVQPTAKQFPVTSLQGNKP